MWPSITAVPPPPGGREAAHVMQAYANRGGAFQHPSGWRLPPWPPTHVPWPRTHGVYGRYVRQRVEASSAELARQRVALPSLPPLSAAGPPYSTHTVEEALAACGAVHGQRLHAKLRLSIDDQALLVPQLAGEWDAEFILNEAKEFMWELCALSHAGPAGQPLHEAYLPGRRAQPATLLRPDGGVEAWR
ncbi:branched chain amino acid aminotransferase isoform A [Micractinium conductrix]|uniref:Branched chain amino acid aminotransferase isoform A n=1 Tax=Micractinium conductrix TaxID=554055 RepID=A0A2P6V8B6_9CHLO|nr:branched chain amino acid aminotransferase isoform A [Micractinium conductrix]|eukprot:PSC70336.1 branched chain amino acid aminotransferase isoform A [Micractinium conductrix]